MNVISHALRACMLIAAALSALWIASTIACAERTSIANESRPSSTLRFCMFLVV